MEASKGNNLAAEIKAVMAVYGKSLDDDAMSKWLRAFKAEEPPDVVAALSEYVQSIPMGNKPPTIARIAPLVGARRATREKQ